MYWPHKETRSLSCLGTLETPRSLFLSQFREGGVELGRWDLFSDLLTMKFW